MAAQPDSSRLQAIVKLIETVHRLRAPGGCPWDRAQTHQSLRQYVIEEAYEVLDVLDRIDSPARLREDDVKGAFREELGDLWMQVLLHSELASEAGAFDIYEVAAALNDKLVRRHPHVFGDVKVDGADAAFKSWETQKAKEKAEKRPDSSALDGVPKGLPGLQRAARVIEKVTKVGFQWPDLSGPLAKLDEELAELRAEVAKLEGADPAKGSRADEAEVARARVQTEIGDLFFSLANVAYLLKINPEDALREQLRRFELRFRHVETRLRESGKAPDQVSLEEMDRHWNEAKERERER